MEAHKVIYLTESGDPCDPLLWCEDRITDGDTKYIRADLFEQGKRWMRHLPRCDWYNYDQTKNCTCGLSKFLEEVNI